MINPDKIREDALRWYNDVLIASIQEKPFFPKDVRFGKIKPSDTLKDFRKIQREIDGLKRNSKEQIGYGYCIEFVRRRDHKIGEQSFPSRIFFDSVTDYLKFVDKEREYEAFISVTERTLTEIPQLLTWITTHPTKVLDNLDVWNDLIKVCKYFMKCPEPNMYVRELPLDISTKFIEDNKAILRMLLDTLIEEHVRKEETTFEKRFNLKIEEQRIRIRILDQQIAQRYFSGINDLSIPQSQLDELNLPCERVFILENGTNISNVYNFLTLPALNNSIAIFGKGFQISLLKDADWLSDKQIIYWGDIDVHGFQILSQLRGYFQKTQSCLMDIETFSEFKHLAVTGAKTDRTELTNLSPEESQLYKYLLSLEENDRLEQEKIPHTYALKKIAEQLDLSGVGARL